MSKTTDEMELNEVADAIEREGFKVGALRIRQAIVTIERLELQEQLYESQLARHEAHLRYRNQCCDAHDVTDGSMICACGFSDANIPQANAEAREMDEKK